MAVVFLKKKGKKMAHLHEIHDADARFLINVSTRAIKNVDAKKTTLIQHDHNSERLTFEMPRYGTDGHDMSKCNSVEVHYLNIDAKTKAEKKGFCVLDDLHISEEDENVIVCSWLVSRNATQLVGSLNFIIRFCCKTDDVIDYAWNTGVCSDVTISNGINASEDFETDYVDVIERWKDSVMQYFTGKIEKSIHDVAQKFITVIDSQDRFESMLGEIPHGGTFKITCDVHAVNDIEILEPCTIFSDNKSKIIFDAGKFILKNMVSLKDIYISGLTYDFDTVSGIINVYAPCIIKGCELDGKTEVTDSVATGIGGYGIALFEGSDGTVIDGNYIHNVSNSFIENWHNNVDLGHPQINNLKIINNILKDSETGDGIALNTNNSLVKGNYLDGKWENGFLVHPKNENGENCENVVFDGNVFNVSYYQDIKNGYGIAIRQADDLLSASNHCQVINNIFNGWGNTSNGVEGIRVDGACKNTIIKCNVFPDKNTPSKAACIRDWGIETIIAENKINMSKGVYAIHKCGGCGKIINNTINASGDIGALAFIDTSGQISVVGNTVTVENSTSEHAIYIQVDDILFAHNSINANNGGISTNTSAKGLLIDGNVFDTGGTAINIYCQNAKIINNRICGGFDGIALYQQSENSLVVGNDIETIGDNGRDCVINYGKDNDIIRNIFRSAVRNALKVTQSANGRCVISNNIFFEGSALALENYLEIILFFQNKFNKSAITYAGSGIVKFDDNVGVDVTRINGIPLIFDGELYQSAIPGSNATNDIANQYKEYIQQHHIVVVYTGTTPYEYYKCMSDGTWKNIY